MTLLIISLEREDSCYIALPKVKYKNCSLCILCQRYES